MWQEAREDRWVDLEAPVCSVKKQYEVTAAYHLLVLSLGERAGTCNECMYQF